MIRLHVTDLSVDASAPDQPPSRSITGLAVPWNVATTDSLGTRVLFEKGSLPEEGRAPKLVESHDLSQVRGLVTERVSTDQGMMFTARIAATRAGDDAMELLKMGALDAVSVGVEPVSYKFDKDGTIRVQSAIWHELSLVAVPAYDQARITSVAASAPEEEDDDPQPQYPEPEEDSMSETPETVSASAPEVIAATPIYAVPKTFSLPSGSEWIAAALEGGERWHKMNEQIRLAAPDVTTTSNDGVLPTPIVGSIYTNYVGNRPVVDVFGARAMPQSGKTFERPSISTHTSMGVQSSELATLTAGEFQVQANTVTKQTVGGFCNVSEQLIDFSSPEIIGALLSDMGRIYANKSDDIAADALVAGATTTDNFTTANIGDPTEWLTWLYDNAAAILSASNGNLPTHLFVSPNIWQALGKLEDSQGRPLFPTVSPMNAFGQMSPGQGNGTAFGLSVVVDRNFASNTLILGDNQGFECWEQQKGAISIDNPSTLSRTIAWRGYFATLMIDASRYVKAAFV